MDGNRFNLCERPVRCRLNEMEVTYRTSQMKTSNKTQTEQKEIRCTEENQSCFLKEWKNVIFSDELRIHMIQDDDVRTFLWCHWNEIYADHCLKEASKFPKSFIIRDCLSVKRPKQMIIIT